MYKFELVFEFEKNKPMYFKYEIDKEDYESFYRIINEFFISELYHEQIEKSIAKVYPEKKVINDFSTLCDIFDDQFLVDGIKKIGKNQYKILWNS